MHLLDLIGLLALLLALGLLVPVAILAVEVWAAMRSNAGDQVSAPATPDTGLALAVLVPAHNEEKGIAANIAAIRAAMPASARLLVVADNCSDGTAALARAAGAEVIERQDPGLRGKGYALDYGVQHLSAAPPDVVVIIDADCTPAPGSIATIAVMAETAGRPVQGLYLLSPPAGGLLPHAKISLVAWRLKNHVRPLGLRALGLPCHLFGTGMALPWPLLSAVSLKSGHLVEDVQLGLDCAAAGRAPCFAPDALFTSPLPTSSSAQMSQRARWEGGHLDVILRRVPRLLLAAARARDGNLLALALDIAVPPLALLALSLAATGLLGLALAVLGGSWGALLVSTLAMSLLLASLAMARTFLIKDTLALADLTSVVSYALSKIMIYFRVFAGRKTAWIRTERD